MPTHEFTVILAGYGEITDDIERRVIAAGCDDGFLFARGGVVYLGFERPAASLSDAFGAAVGALARAGLADYGAARAGFSRGQRPRSAVTNRVNYIQLPQHVRVRSEMLEPKSP